MSYFLRSGDTFRVSTEAAMDIHKKLPGGTYVIKQDMYGNLFLQMIEPLTVPSKIYGDTVKTASRMINTFMDRSTSTGILLNGEKGSGKTLLAKVLSAKCLEQDIPTIVINTPFTGDSFNQLIQAIEQPCVVMFDEFEKVYDRENQEGILTLLDGVFPSKKMFIFTCNDKYRIDDHMRNRPGRIFYMLDFSGLEEKFIIEYCMDRLKNKSVIKDICNMALMFSEFNFDMLQALVEELNRYNETPQEAMRMLNAKPEYSQVKEYNLVLKINGEKTKIDRDTWEGNPINLDKMHLNYEYIIKEKDGETYTDWSILEFSATNLVKFNKETNSFTYVKKDDKNVYELELSRVPYRTFDYSLAF